MGESQVVLAKEPLELTQICMQGPFKEEFLGLMERDGSAQLQP